MGTQRRFLLRARLAAAFLGLTLAASCSSSEQLDDDLLDGKTDNGSWGPRECKPRVAEQRARYGLPPVPLLGAPEVTISIAYPPLMRLRDEDSDYVKYYPLGVGTRSGGVSSTWYPVTATGRQTFSVNPQLPEARCRTRDWGDPHSSATSPLFAGLPFMPFYGLYAIHGPVDGYAAWNGGTLTPGYVSHGCVRMESYDVRELYEHIRHRPSVPVVLTKDGFGQPAVDRAFGPWVMQPCATDADCERIPYGYCRKADPGAADGVCTGKCELYCADRADVFGQTFATTFCIDDPGDDQAGYCVSRAASADECGPGLTYAQERRFDQPSSAPRGVCKPDFD